MFVTLSGSVTLLNAKQLSNAKLPMLVTPSGITTLVKPPQPEAAPPPIQVTPSGRLREPVMPPGTETSNVPSFDNSNPFVEL